jgi:hypothetical protein
VLTLIALLFFTSSGVGAKPFGDLQTSSFEEEYSGYNRPKLAPTPFADPLNPPRQGETYLRGRLVSIPPGSTIPVVLDRAFGSEFSRLGEIGYARIPSTGSYGLPPGTLAEIVVIMVQPAKRWFNKSGKLQLSVNRFILPNGQSIWARGLVVDEAGLASLQGGSTAARIGGSLAKAALGSGIGAASGAGVSALSDGEAGVGAIVGAVTGAAIGGIWAASTKGRNVIIPAGKRVIVYVREGTQAYY